MSLKLGQRISIDLSGIRIAGMHPIGEQAEGTVIEFAPGVITVLLEAENGSLTHVTVSPGRIQRS